MCHETFRNSDMISNLAIKVLDDLRVTPWEITKQYLIQNKRMIHSSFYLLQRYHKKPVGKSSISFGGSRSHHFGSLWHSRPSDSPLTNTEWSLTLNKRTQRGVKRINVGNPVLTNTAWSLTQQPVE